MDFQKSELSINESVFLAYGAKSWHQEISIDQLFFCLVAVQIYVDRYRAIVRHLKSTMVHFIDEVQSKTIGYLNVNEELFKNYRELTDLYTFNHLDVRREIKDFDSKEKELLWRFEKLFNRNSLPRADFAPNQISASQQKLAKDFEVLNAKFKKLKLKNRILKRQICHYEKLYIGNSEEGRSQNSFSVGRIIRANDKQRLSDTGKFIGDQHAKSMDFDARIRKKEADTPTKLTKDNRTINANNARSTPLEMRAKSVANSGKQAHEGHSRTEFGNLQVFETNVEIISLKSDMNRQNEEINQLCKEIALIKAELKDKDREKKIIISDYEKSLREERDRSEKLIINLKRNLEQREQLQMTESSAKKRDKSPKASRECVPQKQIEQLEAIIRKKDYLLKSFKQAIQTYVQEKRELQSQLAVREKELNELRTQINFIGKENAKLIRDRTELEGQNLELIEKFYAAAERENKAIDQYQKLLRSSKARETKIDT